MMIHFTNAHFHLYLISFQCYFTFVFNTWILDLPRKDRGAQWEQVRTCSPYLSSHFSCQVLEKKVIHVKLCSSHSLLDHLVSSCLRISFSHRKEASASPPAGALLFSEASLCSSSGIQMLSVQPDTKPKGCAGCNRKIKDRYLLKALDKYWHEDCLKCACCDCRLGEVGSTLYTKANLILCRRDYLR